MIISRKRFEAEVRRRARRMYRDKCVDTTLDMAASKIANLERRIQRLEKQNQKKGSINGFYATPTETTIVKKEVKNEAE